jgi:hypothetical protein
MKRRSWSELLDPVEDRHALTSAQLRMLAEHQRQQAALYEARSNAEAPTPEQRHLRVVDELMARGARRCAAFYDARAAELDAGAVSAGRLIPSSTADENISQSPGFAVGDTANLSHR